MADAVKLIAIMNQIRERLVDPNADFSRSSWADSEHALAEVDIVLNSLSAGDVPSALLTVLFAPTGPIQEVAIDSGWGDAFLRIAEKFDSAISATQSEWCDRDRNL